MAWTARDDDEKKEYFDSPEELDRKVQQLADWIRESKHFFVFTVSVEKGRARCMQSKSRCSRWLDICSEFTLQKKYYERKQSCFFLDAKCFPCQLVYGSPFSDVYFQEWVPKINFLVFHFQGAGISTSAGSESLVT